MNKSHDKHSLDELCALVDLTKRKVKFYIEKGMIDRPEGAKKGAYYTQKHIEQLLEIKKWQKAGLSLERIKSLYDEKDSETSVPPQKQRQPGDVDVWSHIYFRDGVELLIEPWRSGLSPEQINRLSRAIQALLHSDIPTLED
jgi:DNA-binding transcriptional MerR regulator